jgi:hypothetical protein
LEGDGLAKSALVGDALGDELEAAMEDASGAGAVVRVGSLVVLPVAACQRLMTREPPSIQGSSLEALAGPFVPGPALSLEAFTRPSALTARQAQGFARGQDNTEELGLIDALSLEHASEDALGQGSSDGCIYPALELAVVTTSTSPVHGDATVGGSDDEAVDEEIVVDSPPARGNRDVGVVASLPAATPTVCCFASPPLVFNRARHPAVTRPKEAPAKPRMLGEFRTATKSRSVALMQTMAVRRRSVELNFQTRRSSRITGQPARLSTEMEAVRNLMRKLGPITGDEASSVAVLEAYHKMYELPLMDDMIEAIRSSTDGRFLLDQRLFPTVAGVVRWSPN